MAPEVFRRALRNRLGLPNIVAAEGLGEQNEDDDGEASTEPPTTCTRCAMDMAPDPRHAVGCDGKRNTRHNAVRDVIINFVAESGQKWEKERSFAQLADLTGVSLNAVEAEPEQCDGEG